MSRRSIVGFLAGIALVVVLIIVGIVGSTRTDDPVVTPTTVISVPVTVSSTVGPTSSTIGSSTTVPVTSTSSTTVVSVPTTGTLPHTT